MGSTVRWRSDFDKIVVTSNCERRGWQRWVRRTRPNGNRHLHVSDAEYPMLKPVGGGREIQTGS